MTVKKISRPGPEDPRSQLNERLAPGFWVDQTGALHCSIPEVLDFLGIEDTPENRNVVLEQFYKVSRERNPDVDIVECE